MVDTALKTTFQLLQQQVKELITLQKAEDEMPNPLDFAQQVRDYNATQLTREIDELLAPEKNPADDNNEGFDPEKMRRDKLRKIIKQITDLIGIQPPVQPVETYPFKTKDGHALPICVRRIFYCFDNIQELTAGNNKMTWLAKQLLKRCLREITKHFPDVITGEGLSKKDPLLYQHYFVRQAYAFLKIAKETLPITQEIGLLKVLWTTFCWWIEYQTKRIISAFKY